MSGVECVCGGGGGHWLISDSKNKNVLDPFMSTILSELLPNQMSQSSVFNPDVTGYRLGISYTCTVLRFKPAFIATW